MKISEHLTTQPAVVPKKGMLVVGSAKGWVYLIGDPIRGQTAHFAHVAFNLNDGTVSLHESGSFVGTNYRLYTGKLVLENDQ